MNGHCSLDKNKRSCATICSILTLTRLEYNFFPFKVTKSKKANVSFNSRPTRSGQSWVIQVLGVLDERFYNFNLTEKAKNNLKLKDNLYVFLAYNFFCVFLIYKYFITCPNRISHPSKIPIYNIFNCNCRPPNHGHTFKPLDKVISTHNPKQSYLQQTNFTNLKF